MQETCDNCFGSEKRNAILRQTKLGEQEGSKISARKLKYLVVSSILKSAIWNRSICFEINTSGREWIDVFNFKIMNRMQRSIELKRKQQIRKISIVNNKNESIIDVSRPTAELKFHTMLGRGCSHLISAYKRIVLYPG